MGGRRVDGYEILIIVRINLAPNSVITKQENLLRTGLLPKGGLGLTELDQPQT
jgi:hypothetical protein